MGITSIGFSVGNASILSVAFAQALSGRRFWPGWHIVAIVFLIGGLFTALFSLASTGRGRAIGFLSIGASLAVLLLWTLAIAFDVG